MAVGEIPDHRYRDGFVTDFTKTTLTVQDDRSLETTLHAYEWETTQEIAVVVISTLGDEPIEQYAVDLFGRWGIGKKGKDNGVLLLIALDDREWKIEVGYGLEGYLTDAAAGRIGRESLTQHFRSGNYALGIRAAVDGITSHLRYQTSPERQAEREQAERDARIQAEESRQFWAAAWPVILSIVFFGAFAGIALHLNARRKRAGAERAAAREKAVWLLSAAVDCFLAAGRHVAELQRRGFKDAPDVMRDLETLQPSIEELGSFDQKGTTSYFKSMQTLAAAVKEAVHGKVGDLYSKSATADLCGKVLKTTDVESKRIRDLLPKARDAFRTLTVHHPKINLGDHKSFFETLERELRLAKQHAENAASLGSIEKQSFDTAGKALASVSQALVAAEGALTIVMEFSKKAERARLDSPKNFAAAKQAVDVAYAAIDDHRVGSDAKKDAKNAEESLRKASHLMGNGSLGTDWLAVAAAIETALTLANGAKQQANSDIAAVIAAADAARRRERERIQSNQRRREESSRSSNNGFSFGGGRSGGGGAKGSW